MFNFKKSSRKNEAISVEKTSKNESAAREVRELSAVVDEHKPIEKVTEQRKGLKVNSHKVSGKELNAVIASIDESFIQVKSVQAETMSHIRSLYQMVDALDEEHLAKILAAVKAAEIATDWARVNDENIGKITAYLMKDERVKAHIAAQDSRIADLEKKIKLACAVAVSSAVIALISFVVCLITMI